LTEFAGELGEGAFGAAEAAGGDEAEAGAGISPWPMDLGHGNYMVLDPAAIEALFTTPQANAAVQARAQSVIDIANGLAVLHGVVYEAVEINTGPWATNFFGVETTRPVIVVRPKNFWAYLEEQQHSTLMIAAHMAGNDPKVTYENLSQGLPLDESFGGFNTPLGVVMGEMEAFSEEPGTGDTAGGGFEEGATT